jgi:pyruvate/2-oxoglutarate/acetoin dehydrogenase E1 component
MTGSTGFSAEAAVVATEDATTFTQLKAPVKRVCALQVSVRYSQDRVLPRRREGAMAVGSLFRFRHFYHTLYSDRLA